MKRVALVQVGFGTVGGTLLEQVIEHRDAWRQRFDLDVCVMAVAGRRGAHVAPSDAGFDGETIRGMVRSRRAGSVAGNDAMPLTEAVRSIAASGPTILLDAATGEQTTDAIVAVLEAGGEAVLSNKAPMALPTSDPRTGVLWSEAVSGGRLRYEATCGAGLPVISTLQSLLDTGDTVLEISGTVSGTFGAIFSRVGQGEAYSEAVKAVKAQGYTEPDPRDDLSGLDVARKGLILARTMGQEINLDDIVVHSLVPSHLQDVSVDEFLKGLQEQDAEIGKRARDAAASDGSLKYLVDWSPERGVQVGLRTVPRTTVLGALQGPENIVSFRTQRYDQYPCVVSGPGAGAAVTAAGMVSDMLSLARQLPA